MDREQEEKLRQYKAALDEKIRKLKEKLEAGQNRHFLSALKELEVKLETQRNDVLDRFNNEIKWIDRKRSEGKTHPKMLDSHKQMATTQLNEQMEFIDAAFEAFIRECIPEGLNR